MIEIEILTVIVPEYPNYKHLIMIGVYFENIKGVNMNFERDENGSSNELEWWIIVNGIHLIDQVSMNDWLFQITIEVMSSDCNHGKEFDYYWV